MTSRIKYMILCELLDKEANEQAAILQDIGEFINRRMGLIGERASIEMVEVVTEESPTEEVNESV